MFNKLTKIVCYSFKKACDTTSGINDFEKKGIFDSRTLLGSNFLNIRKDFEDSEIDIELIDPVESFLNLLMDLRIAAPLNKNDDRYFMPFVLESCELNDLEKRIPEHKEHYTEPPLLVQFTSNVDKTSSFPRGVFCFLVVDLMLHEKWTICQQAYVNLIILNAERMHCYVTLIDRIFCLEIYVTYKDCCNFHNKIRQIIDETLQKRVAEKLKIHSNLCHGFFCSSCPEADELHISYLSEDNDECCRCDESNVSTKLMKCHRVWLTNYFRKVNTCHVYLHYYLVSMAKHSPI